MELHVGGGADQECVCWAVTVLWHDGVQWFFGGSKVDAVPDFRAKMVSIIVNRKPFPMLLKCLRLHGRFYSLSSTKRSAAKIAMTLSLRPNPFRRYGALLAKQQTWRWHRGSTVCCTSPLLWCWNTRKVPAVCLSTSLLILCAHIMLSMAAALPVPLMPLLHTSGLSLHRCTHSGRL